MNRLSILLVAMLLPGPVLVTAQNSGALGSRPRLRELGISIGVLSPGKANAITDVAGVMVGHQTIVEGDSIRTGVTAIRPHPGNVFLHKVPAAVHVANGFGKLVGTTQVQELGVIETPIILTNTLSAFKAADALVGWTLAQPGCDTVRSVNPIVGECNDGYLNDIRLRRVKESDIKAALQNARTGPVQEGCVGAGTGVRCMGWKGGIGTSSRVLPKSLGGYTVGVLVQTNFGGSLTIDGVPVGRMLGRYYLKDEIKTQEHGSCMVVVATDAPLDARRLARLARRAPLGLAAAGSPISHGSGDYVLAFSTVPELRTSYEATSPKETVTLLRDDQMSPLFQAVRDATEEAVINSMLRARTTNGRQDRTVEALDPTRIIEICRQRRAELSDLPVSNATAPQRRMSNPRIYPNSGPSDSLLRKLAKFEASLSTWMDDYKVPGVSIAVIEDRQLVWSRGYGVRFAGSGASVQSNTVMEACSMSKPFFAYMFLRLVEQGRAELDRPLVDYLGKDYLKEEPRQREITARMVLSHTSGLPNWRRGGWRSGGAMSLAFDPGTQFQYSGEGFLMLQRAVEVLTGTGLDKLSQEMLIDPLGLTGTRYVWIERLMADAAGGHDREGHLKDARKYYDSANAAYTLYTSAEDYARFVVEIMKQDRSAEHSLDSEMVKEMLTPFSHREDQDADWGLGWGLRDRGSDGDRTIFAYHSGSNGTGFRCYSEFSAEEGEGIVIMTNAVGGKELWNAAIEQWHGAPE